MVKNIKYIYNLWKIDNFRYGALGFIVRDFLIKHSTSLEQYQAFIHEWNVKYENTFNDWYLPSIVEQLSNWTYDINFIYQAITTSQNELQWEALFPHAFDKMSRFDLIDYIKWDSLVKQYNHNIQKEFYQHLNFHTLCHAISLEIKKENVLNHKYNFLLTSLLQFKESDSDIYDKLLNSIDKINQNSNLYDSMDLMIPTPKYNNAFHTVYVWLKNVNIKNKDEYIIKASELLDKQFINWNKELLSVLISRLDDYQEELISILSNRKNIPWGFIIQNKYHLNFNSILYIIYDSKELQDLILSDHNYNHELKKKILFFKCQQNKIYPNDFYECKHWDLYFKQMLLFWYYQFSYKNIDFELPIQKIFKMHPLLEKDKLLNKYLPGFYIINSILSSLDYGWDKSWNYMYNAINQNQQNDIINIDYTHSSET